MSWMAMSWTTTGFLAVLLLVNIAFLIGWLRARRTHPLRDKPTVGDAVIGFVTDFFDALGIGSFAPTTALFKLRGRPADEQLWRFMCSGGRRKTRYARLLVEALDPARVPRPLERLLAHV